MNVEIANKLVKLRKQLGLSQEELAERIGVSRQAVSKWERSESSPDTDNLIALSRVYGISIDEMLDPEKGAATEERTQDDSKDNDNYSYDDVYEESEDDKGLDLAGLKGAVPIIAVITFMILGLFWGLWHPGWLVFLLIPVVYFLWPEKIDGKWTIRPTLRKFPYPVLATFIFLLLGFLLDGWAWAWLIFLTIPIWAIIRKN